MTDVAYNVNAANVVYKENVFVFLDAQKRNILNAADKLGVSAGAIAGAMAEENDAYGYDDKVLDLYAQSGIKSEEAVASLSVAVINGTAALVAWMAIYGAELLLTKRTHEEWVADYEAVKNMTGAPGKVDKVMHPTLVDAGPCNFKIQTAIGLVNEYALTYPDLGLDIYLNDYALLIDDLMNGEKSLTATLYGLYIKEKAEPFFIDHGAYGAQWGALPQEFRDALLITYTNRGEDGMLTSMKTPYEPQPGATQSGGMHHLLNIQQIASAIGLAGYGDNVDAVDFGSKALENSAEALAYRYALVKMRYVALPGLNYDANELSLYDPSTGTGVLTESYLRDRSMMLDLYCTDYIGGKAVSPNGAIYRDQEKDVALGDRFYLRNQSEVIFGSNNAETLEGKDASDRLYGGDGNDTLIGGGGADYLEGGQGVDTYVLNSSDKGVDTILDTDGLGRIMLDGEDLSGLSFKRPNIPIADGNAGQVYYAGQNNQYRLSKTSETQWQLAALVNGNYRILTNLENWKSGDLGITADSVSTPGVAPEDVKFDLDHSNSTLYHNYIGTSSPNGIWVRGSDSKSAQFSGSNHDDVIYTGNGGSHIVMGWTGNDYIRGGEGREYILAGSNIAGIANDNDVVYGGANSDIISGGGGNDTLWADDGSDSYLTETATSAERGDWINGQHGSDILYGGDGSEKTVYPFAMAA